MKRFKNGDLVQPSDGCYTGNTHGSPYNLPRSPMRVTNYLDDRCMKVLVGENESPPVNPQCFELAPQVGPVREVIRKEIVSGTYGIVQLGDVVYGGVPLFISTSCVYSAAQLRAASTVLAAVADALDGK